MHSAGHYARQSIPNLPVASGSRLARRTYMVEKGNRPSIGTTYSEDNAVSGLVLEGYYTKGYAARYGSMFEAEKKHGGILVSPLGNLTNNKPDGTLKHRIMVDLRRRGANLLAALFERIVLPRPSDHGRDLYILW